MFCAAERGLSSFSKFQYTISDALSQHLIAGNGKEARRKRRGRLLPPSRTPLLLSSRPISWVNTAYPFGAAYLLARGALDVRARCIKEDMKTAAAYAIASLVGDDELTPRHIIPDALDRRVGPAVAKAVAEAAVRSGVARKPLEP